MNAIDIGHVFRDLGADNDIERRIGLRDLRCIANRIGKPLRRISRPAKRDQVARNIDAGDSPVAADAAAMLSHRKPGPQPISSTRSPGESASCFMVSARCATTSG
jgi:hypothetical protein